jgi:Protein of unknown function (DUF1214)
MGSDSALSRVANGQSWEQFCDRLKEAGQIVLRQETPSSEIDRAEGWRYLSRLTRMALEVCFENSDPDFPTLLNIPHATAKAGADNPDNLYLTAAIAGDREYRLRGTRGTVPLLSFSTKSLVAGAQGTTGQAVATSTGGLDGKSLLVNPDGTFEIAVSSDPRPGNWLPLSAESNVLVVRQTFLDKVHEVPATVVIQRVGGPLAPRPLSAKRADWALKAAADLVTRIALRYADWAKWYKAIPNTLSTIEGSPLREEGADPNIRYLYGYWSIGADEALVIETPVPPCELWNFQINNYWMESLDYRYHRIWVNKQSAQYNADGSVTLVVAASDPGVGNFLDTAGHRCGTMVLRWTRAEHHPVPQCRVEKLDVLRERASIVAKLQPPARDQSL